jgi:hypothetical protein
MLLKTRIVTQLTKFALRRPDKDSAEDSLNKREAGVAISPKDTAKG